MNTITLLTLITINVLILISCRLLIIKSLNALLCDTSAKKPGYITGNKTRLCHYRHAAIWMKRPTI